MSSSDSQYGYWHYDPSHTAAVVGTILYLITTVVTFVQWIKYRAWVWVVVLLGVICASFYSLSSPSQHYFTSQGSNAQAANDRISVQWNS